MAEEGGCGSDAVEREEAAAVEPEVAAKAAIRWHFCYQSVTILRSNISDHV